MYEYAHAQKLFCGTDIYRLINEGRGGQIKVMVVVVMLLLMYDHVPC